MNENGTPVDNPTYIGHIRHFFEDMDIAHMGSRGMDLATYEGVKFNALRIHFTTQEETMPPEKDRKWSNAQKATFYNWMKNGCPRGTDMPASPGSDGQASRIRRNLADLEDNELNLLKKAFREIMSRDPVNDESYFAIAGIHWLPGPELYCRHHENGYNPWHRAYLMMFENALRSVKGCENVTLPYWDILGSTIPKVLYEEPFVSYKIPRELCSLGGNCYEKNYETQRYAPSRILKEIKARRIPETIENALGSPHWERFNGWDTGLTQEGIIRAHDNGHVAGGITLTNQDIAAFEPIFWFFHANWDRLWWKWQQSYDAMNLNKFKNRVLGSTDWLDEPVLNALPPFSQTSAQMIDLSNLDVMYKHPVKDPTLTLTTPQFGSIEATRSFSVDASRKASVRLKGVNRLEIPGSFDVHLSADGKIVGKQAFFQSTEPKHCETCRKNEIVNFDFVVDHEVLSGKVQCEIQLYQKDGSTAQFPLHACGNPSINVRLLLED